jgi:excinuclease UvrABC ATPase subunit
MGVVLDAIEVVGASRQNLENLSLNIGHGQISVLTGPSSCGKTSLAVGVIGAESNYRLTVLASRQADNDQ